MLDSIHLKNFAIVSQAEVEFRPGFNVLSGETGAGKSILIDALGLILGDRADSSWVRHGQTNCDIQAHFSFTNPAIGEWLSDYQFHDSEESQAQLRRNLRSQGKHQAYINGIPATLNHNKAVGEMLVNIHGQHAHQSLTDPDKQLDILDQYKPATALRQQVKTLYNDIKKLEKDKRQLLENSDDLPQRLDFLSYQLEELNALNLADGEFAQLAEKQKQFSNLARIQQTVVELETLLTGAESNLQHSTNAAAQLAEKLSTLDERSQEISHLLEQASIYLDEASSALRSYANKIDGDPEEIANIEARMQQLFEVARKHRVEPEQLSDKQQAIDSEIAELSAHSKTLAKIDEQLAELKKQYQVKATELSKHRQQQAKKLEKEVIKLLAELSMSDAKFIIEFSLLEGGNSKGIDKVVFLIAPNPGQPAKPLHKIASGGELSRISLAIQVASISQNTDTTLIFDEVDSGIGGATAEVVGRLLAKLARYNQIICVTHLPQVAAYADHHIFISKRIENKATFTEFKPLAQTQQVLEIARMSGGINMDKQTQQHAENLLENAAVFKQTIN